MRQKYSMQRCFGIIVRCGLHRKPLEGGEGLVTRRFEDFNSIKAENILRRPSFRHHHSYILICALRKLVQRQITL